MEFWTDSTGGIGGALVRWIALLPLASAVVHGLLIGVVRANFSKRSIWTISMSALGTAFLLTLLSTFDFVRDDARVPVIDAVGPWIGGGVGARSFSAEVSFQFDALSSVFCVALTTIALAVYIFVIGRQQTGEIDPEQGHRTFATLDLLVGSTLLLFLADNFLLFFLGWAGIGIASQLFSSFVFESKQAGRAGATTFIIGRIGDLGLLAAMLLLFDGLARAGAPLLTFRGIEGAYRLLEGQQVLLVEQIGVGPPGLLELVGVGLVLAAMTKCAQLPLHIWIPNSTSSPVSAAALMQSATTVVAGVYVLLRFAFLLESAPLAMNALVWIGTATLVLASLASANQFDLARFVAFTTSAHLGFVLVGIGLGIPSVATFHLLTHAFTKAQVVLALGVVIVTLRGETDLRKMGGLGIKMRWTAGFAAIGLLGLAGIPPLAGFFSIEETLAFLHVSERPDRSLLKGLALASLGILAFANARVFSLVFWGNVRPGGLDPRVLEDPAGWPQRSLGFLTLMAVFVGLLTPSQFWGDLWGLGVSQVDSVGFFLSESLPGPNDPALGGADRWRLLGILTITVVLGFGAGWARYARRGYPVEPKMALLVWVRNAMREMLFIEEIYGFVLLRPLRAVSRWALAVGIEQRLLEGVVVSGSSSLVRRAVWGGLRRIQNGRLQSYALLGLLAVLVAVTFMVSCASVEAEAASLVPGVGRS